MRKPFKGENIKAFIAREVSLGETDLAEGEITRAKSSYAKRLKQLEQEDNEELSITGYYPVKV